MRCFIIDFCPTTSPQTGSRVFVFHGNGFFFLVNNPSHMHSIPILPCHRCPTHAPCTRPTLSPSPLGVVFFFVGKRWVSLSFQESLKIDVGWLALFPLAAKRFVGLNDCYSHEEGPLSGIRKENRAQQKTNWGKQGTGRHFQIYRVPASGKRSSRKIIMPFFSDDDAGYIYDTNAKNEICRIKKRQGQLGPCNDVHGDNSGQANTGHQRHQPCAHPSALASSTCGSSLRLIGGRRQVGQESNTLTVGGLSLDRNQSLVQFVLLLVILVVVVAIHAAQMCPDSAAHAETAHDQEQGCGLGANSVAQVHQRKDESNEQHGNVQSRETGPEHLGPRHTAAKHADT